MGRCPVCGKCRPPYKNARDDEYCQGHSKWAYTEKTRIKIENMKIVKE